jgi:hypothetical protein
MKNKKSVYILLPLVVIIWGIIFYRIFTGTSNDQYNLQTQKTLKVSDEYEKPQSFKIYTNYKDPFLKSIRQKKETKKTEKTTKKKNTRSFSSRRRRRTLTRWPDISYKGTVKNQGKTRNVFLVEIEKQSFLTHPGDTLKGVVIKKCYEDSIVVHFKDRKKTIKRKNQ